MDDKYLNYSAQALAGEEAFIAWVMYGRNADTWQAWQTAHPAMQEKLQHARSIVLMLSNPDHQSLSMEEKGELWNRINSGIQQETKPASTARRLSLRWVALAAAAVALLIWIALPGGSTKVIAEAGEHIETQLPEKSEVVLNAGSKMSYDKKDFKKDRTLELEGEAFFNVEKGSTFSVKTAHGVVTVLGTSFNVLSRDDRFEVQCYTGKVRVENLEQEGVEITPGQQVVLKKKNNNLRKENFEPKAEKPEWTEGRFRFDNQSLQVVFGELERQYGVKVELPEELRSIKYTGLFEAGDLDEAVKMITWPRHLKYTIEGKTVHISS